jgi:hypothetical protein
MRAITYLFQDFACSHKVRWTLWIRHGKLHSAINHLLDVAAGTDLA